MMKVVLGTHTEVREFLLEYQERRLPWLKRLRFWLHLWVCPPCGDYLDRYNTGVSLAKNFLQDPPPEELVHITLKFLEAHRHAPADEPETTP